MKKEFLFGILFCVNIFIVCADEPYVTKNFPSSSIKTVEAFTGSGSITITGDNVSEAIVEVYVWRDDWTDEKCKKAFEEHFALNVDVNDNKLIAQVKPKKDNLNWKKQGVNISFTITVPKQVHSKLQSEGGDIKIANLIGSQDIKTENGSLNVENITGNVYGITKEGDIFVTKCFANIDVLTNDGNMTVKDNKGNIILKSSKGEISVNNCNGKVVLKTVNSNANLNNISGNIDAKSANGNLNIKMASVSEFIKISNYDNVNLTMPSGIGYNLNINADEIEVSGLENFVGRKDSKIIEGTVGEGGPEIEIVVLKESEKDKNRKLRLAIE